VLFRAPEIGGQDWYRWGLRTLTKRQKADGSWAFDSASGYSAPIDTNFALLFLRQANLAEDLSDKLEDFLLLSHLEIPLLEPRRV
jgi:hypothetical protein